MIYKSPLCFLIGLSVQEKKWKMNFQDTAILNFSLFLFTSHPDASYQVSSPLAFWFRTRAKNRFSRWLPLPFAVAFFLSTSHADASYQLSSQLAFQFKRRSENRFTRQPSWSWISNQNDFSYFWSTSHPMLLIFWVNWLLVQEKVQKIEWPFSSGSHLVHPSWTVWAMLIDGHPRNIPEKLFQNPSTGWGEDV